MKKVILLIAGEGYQPIEYEVPKQVLQNKGFEVITVSDVSGRAISSDPEQSTEVDFLISEINTDSADALFLIGGPGALDHLDNDQVYKLLQDWQNIDKPYGAICISPRILARAGVLQNKKATGWDGDEKLAEIFAKNNVEYVHESVVVDGNIITANGPTSAQQFAEKIAEILG